LQNEYSSKHRVAYSSLLKIGVSLHFGSVSEHRYLGSVRLTFFVK
jgi:hypothetical protein